MNGWLGRDILGFETYRGNSWSWCHFGSRSGQGFVFPHPPTLDTLCGPYRVWLGFVFWVSYLTQFKVLLPCITGWMASSSKMTYQASLWVSYHDWIPVLCHNTASITVRSEVWYLVLLHLQYRALSEKRFMCAALPSCFLSTKVNGLVGKGLLGIWNMQVLGPTLVCHFGSRLGAPLLFFFPPTTTLDTLCGYYRVGMGISCIYPLEGDQVCSSKMT